MLRCRMFFESFIPPSLREVRLSLDDSLAYTVELECVGEVVLALVFSLQEKGNVIDCYAKLAFMATQK